jgi:O-antigen ligase
MKIGSARAKQVTDIINQSPEKLNSANIRLFLWKDAMEVVKEHPLLGVGTGDIKEALMAQYRKSGFELGIERNYSPHNQFLHTAVILGFAGVMLLISLLIVSGAVAWQKKNMIHMLMILIIFLNGFTEDILEVQKGILFFAFFNSFFYWKEINRPQFKIG